MAGGKVSKRQVGLRPNRPRCQLMSATACFTSRVQAPEIASSGVTLPPRSANDGAGNFLGRFELRSVGQLEQDVPVTGFRGAPADKIFSAKLGQGRQQVGLLL